MDEKTPNRIIAFIKSNKKNIVRGGLILIGTVAGITLVTLATKKATMDLYFEDDVDVKMVDGKLVISTPETD